MSDHQPSATRQGILTMLDVARIEEARLARGLVELTEHRFIGAPSLREGAAVAGRAEPGSWFNIIVNLGMGVSPAGDPIPVDADELAGIVAWYAERGLKPTIELCPHAHPSAMHVCAKLSFIINPAADSLGRTEGFETLFYRDLKAPLPTQPDIAGLELRVVEVADQRLVKQVVELSVTRDLPSAPPPTDMERDTTELCMRHPRTLSFAAFVHGEIAGAGFIEIGGESGALFGAKVLSRFRRVGVQQALIIARLSAAAERGARIATIGSRPGVPTERNALRMGFSVAYTKPLLVLKGS